MDLNPAIELALRCDLRGRLLEILRAPRGFGGTLAPGNTFASIVAGGSAAAALGFLFALRSEGVVLGRELKLSLPPPRDRTLRFGGVAITEGFLVVASHGQQTLSRFFAQLLAAGEDPPHETGARDELPGLKLTPIAREGLARKLGDGGASPVPSPARDRELTALLRLGRRRSHRLAAGLPEAARREAEEVVELWQQLLDRYAF